MMADSPPGIPFKRPRKFAGPHPIQARLLLLEAMSPHRRQMPSTWTVFANLPPRTPSEMPLHAVPTCIRMLGMRLQRGTPLLRIRTPRSES